MGREGSKSNSIVFGKIGLASDTASMQELEKSLFRILKAHGYPEQQKAFVDEEEEPVEPIGIEQEVENNPVEEEEEKSSIPWQIRRNGNGGENTNEVDE